MNDLPAGLSPCGDPAWRDSALAWVRGRLRAAGMRPARQDQGRSVAYWLTRLLEPDPG